MDGRERKREKNGENRKKNGKNERKKNGKKDARGIEGEGETKSSGRCVTLVKACVVYFVGAIKHCACAISTPVQ